MDSTARLALVAQLDAQIVKRVDRLAANPGSRPLQLAILSLAEQSATHLRPTHPDAGVHARAHVAYLLAAGHHGVIRTRYLATA